MQVEQITDPVAYHAEGPIWWPGWGGLRWVDMLAGDVLSLRPDGSIGRRSVGSIAACVRPRAGGGAVIGVERGFALEDPDGTLHVLPPVFLDAGVRMNEGDCDPHGRFWCGSMAADSSPSATLYRLDPDRTVTPMLTGVTVSNGLAWTADGTRAFYNDTATQQVATFDVDADRGLVDRRVFAEIADADGHPDGLTVDAEGGVWVALYGGGAVRHYLPDGTLADVIELPASKVTACTFGGEQLDELFITTSREDLPDDAEPLAGSMFRARPGVTGQPARTFAG
jgi:sugar lactone lactonase YvrE